MTTQTRAQTNEALANHTNVEYQVWAETPEGGLFLHRDNLIYGVALNWAATFTAEEAGLPAGTKFFAVQAVTSFERI